MELDLAKLLSSTPLWILAGAALLYVLRGSFDAAIKARFATLEKRVDASLAIKTGLRGHEQDELVAFRVAVEKWEYFLQTGVGELTMGSEDKNFDPSAFYRRDQALFGAVRLAAVKASIFLRDAGLEVELLRTISAIRGLYYPALEATLRDLIDIQGEMLPYLNRMQLFAASGQKDTSVALTAEEAQLLIGLRHRLTDGLQAYAETLVANYKPIAEQLYELKDKINVHIYRPLADAQIDRRAG